VGVRKLETKEDVKMKIVVLKDLPWDTSRGDVVAALSGDGLALTEIIEDYGRHVLFTAGGKHSCVLLVPGSGNVHADRRPPYLLLDIEVEPDASCDESRFSPAMQDEVRSVRNTLARVKARALAVRLAGHSIHQAMIAEGMII
jgi:hypothetical protein